MKINGPVGLLALALIAVTLQELPSAVAERKRLERQGNGFDLIGFVLVATFLGALELALDRGLEDDWFGSSFIVAVVAVCALAFVLMIPWELSRRDPIIDVRMVATRQFGACFLVMAGDRRHPAGHHQLPAAAGAGRNTATRRPGPASCSHRAALCWR